MTNKNKNNKQQKQQPKTTIIKVNNNKIHLITIMVTKNKTKK